MSWKGDQIKEGDEGSMTIFSKVLFCLLAGSYDSGFANSAVHFRVSVPIILTKRGQHECPMCFVLNLTTRCHTFNEKPSTYAKREIITPSLGFPMNVSFSRSMN